MKDDNSWKEFMQCLMLNQEKTKGSAFYKMLVEKLAINFSRKLVETALDDEENRNCACVLIAENVTMDMLDSGYGTKHWYFIQDSSLQMLNSGVGELQYGGRALIVKMVGLCIMSGDQWPDFSRFIYNSFLEGSNLGQAGILIETALQELPMSEIFISRFIAPVLRAIPTKFISNIKDSILKGEVWPFGILVRILPHCYQQEWDALCESATNTPIFDEKYCLSKRMTVVGILGDVMRGTRINFSWAMLCRLRNICHNLFRSKCGYEKYLAVRLSAALLNSTLQRGAQPI